MIDKKYQGNGYGKEAMKLAIDFIKTYPSGKTDYCWLSYEPENEVARKLYLSLGFLLNISTNLLIISSLFSELSCK